MEITTENYFELKSRGLKRCEIATTFNMTDGQLKKYITKMGWAKPKPIIEFENAFDELDEYSCYWGGFLASDGNVDSKNRVRIMLNYDDTGHLEKFKEFLGSTHQVSSNTDKYYRSSFELTSRHICCKLKEYFNIIPNKTDRLKFPSNLNTEQLRHYLRGYFDGDGSICESFSNKNSTTATLYATFCSGCEDFTNTLFITLNSLLGLHGNNQKYSNKHQIKYCTKDAIVLLSWLYEDSEVYLDRKYTKYLDIVRNNNRKVR